MFLHLTSFRANILRGRYWGEPWSNGSPLDNCSPSKALGATMENVEEN